MAVGFTRDAHDGPDLKSHQDAASDDARVQAPEESTPGGQAPHGRHITLAPDTALTIGSDPSNQLVLAGDDVEPHHARIVTDATGEATITDLAQASGTYVNGMGVENARLAPGAEVCIGPHRFVFTGTELMRHGESNNVRVDAIDLTQSVRVGGIGPIGGRTKLLLDHVSLTIERVEKP